MNIEDLRKIPFPPLEKLDWLSWPSVPEDIALPPDMEFWFAGDMIQLGVLWLHENKQTLITNQDNCVGLLHFVLEWLFPGNYTWYDLQNSFGATDYFWYSQSIECGHQYVEQLPMWCQSAWKVLIDEEIVRNIKDFDSDTAFFYVEDLNHLPRQALHKAYQKLLPIFINEMVAYQTIEGNVSEINELSKDISNVFSTLIANLASE